MVDFISSIIAAIIVLGIPALIRKSESANERRNMYDNLNKKQQDETEKWRR